MLWYHTTHYSRVLETEVRLTFKQRLKVLFGLPVEITVDRNYPAAKETPLTSASLDIRSRVSIV